MRNTAMHAAALAAAVLAAWTIGTAVLYEAAQAGHDCPGEDCAICRQIAACRTLLLGVGALASGAAAVRFSACREPEKLRESRRSNASPVTLRVKLTD